MAKSSLNPKGDGGRVQGAARPAPDTRIRVDLIDVEAQLRTYFDEEAQAGLNASVKAQGVLQPVILLAKPDGRYRLIAGERRLRAIAANALEDIPAVIRHGLAPWEIRRIQVSENAQRDDITPHDEARGVAQDVETYGVARTMEIWGRSEGWVSKRMGVAKYAEPIKQLLQERVLGDLEVAHSLNQVHGLNQQEFARLEKRLRAGLPLSREEARGKVQQVREWQDETKQRAARRQALGENPSAPAGAARAGAVTRATGTPRQTAKVGTTAAAAEGGAPISSEQAVVLEQMVTLFKIGLASRNVLKAVQDELAELGADMNQTEWAMWSLYQTVMLPLLAALGEARAQRYLQRTIAELRNATPQALWDQLHPAVDGAAPEAWSEARTPVAPMPKDWRF
jgi:ParB family chromosome partitioning protein